MPEKELQKIADNANFIVSGYAFTKRDDGFVSILNLDHPECATKTCSNETVFNT